MHVQEKHANFTWECTNWFYAFEICGNETTYYFSDINMNEQKLNNVFIQQNILLLLVMLIYFYIHMAVFPNIPYIKIRLLLLGFFCIIVRVIHTLLCSYIVRNSMASSTESWKYSISTFPSSLFSEFPCWNVIIALLKSNQVSAFAPKLGKKKYSRTHTHTPTHAHISSYYKKGTPQLDLKTYKINH